MCAVAAYLEKSMCVFIMLPRGSIDKIKPAKYIFEGYGTVGSLYDIGKSIRQVNSKISWECPITKKFLLCIYLQLSDCPPLPGYLFMQILLNRELN